MHNQSEGKTWKELHYHAVIFSAASIMLVCQFIVPGYYHKFVEDAVYTPCYIAQYAESFRQGILYPRWMPLCFGGYGSPVSIFYSPLLYMSAGLLHLAGFDIPSSVNLLKLLSVYTGGISMFYLVREGHTDRAALFAALLYVLLPSSILENYIINTPAGRMSHAWLPVTLLAARRLTRGPASRGNIALMAASYAGLILTHIATAYIFSPFIALFGILSVKSGSNVRGGLRLALGLVAGICLSSVLLLPVILERSLLQINLLETLKYMSDWRMPLLLTFDAPVDVYVRHIWDVLRYCMLIEATLAALLFYALRRYTSFRLGEDGRVYFWLLLAALFMMSSLSAPIWRYLPGMSSINFPSRFLSASMLFSSVLLGLLLDGFLGWEARAKTFSAGVAVLVISVAVCDGLLIYRSLPPVPAAWAEGQYGVVDMVEYLPADTDINTLYGLTGKEPLLSRTDPFTQLDTSGKILTSEDRFGSNISTWGCTDRKFSVVSPGGAHVRVRTFYFPGWRAWVDGSEIPIGVEDKTGAMLLDVPAGSHSVTLKFTETWPRTAGKMLSLFTIALLVLPYGLFRGAKLQAL